MKNKKLNEDSNIYSDKLPPKYSKANKEFEYHVQNHPDFSKMEPMEIYNWIEKLVSLTKI